MSLRPDRDGVIRLRLHAGSRFLVALDMSGLLINTFSLCCSVTGERTLKAADGMVYSETTHIKERHADRTRSSWMIELFFVA